MEQLNKKEIHQLAMQEVGNFLKTQGYEFLGVNSKVKKTSEHGMCINKLRLISFSEISLYIFSFLLEISGHVLVTVISKHFIYRKKNFRELRICICLGVVCCEMNGPIKFSKCCIQNH